ncbi:hypothetical protein D9M72_369750 [compost metagenome]
MSCTGANITSQRVAGTGYRYAQTLTGAASVTATLWGQRIAASNCWDWVGKRVNVQVPISAAGITTATWNAYTADVADNFTAKTLIATGTLSLSGTVETKFFSFNAGSNASRGIAIEIETGPLLAAQTITYQGAIQAEANQVSPFEVIEDGEDLRRCQRYLPVIGLTAAGTNGIIATGQCTSTTTAVVPIQLKVPTRVPVTGLVSVNPTSFQVASAAYVGATTASIALHGTASADSVGLLVTTSGAALVAGDATTFVSVLAGGQLIFTGAEL